MGPKLSSNSFLIEAFETKLKKDCNLVSSFSYGIRPSLKPPKRSLPSLLTIPANLISGSFRRILHFWSYSWRLDSLISDNQIEIPKLKNKNLV